MGVANTIGRIEERILRLEPEGGPELQQLLAEVARRKGQLKKYLTLASKRVRLKRR